MLTKLQQSSTCFIIYKRIVIVNEKNNQINVSFGGQAMLSRFLAFYIALNKQHSFLSAQQFQMHA